MSEVHARIWSDTDGRERDWVSYPIEVTIDYGDSSGLLSVQEAEELVSALKGLIERAKNARRLG